jgi:aldehyde:ferredoxin oxidoreductase
MNGWTWDPRVRGLGNIEFTQMTSPRGAHLSTSGAGTPRPGLSPQEVAADAKRIGIPDEAIPRVVPEAGVSIGRFNRYTEDWVSLLDCAGICAQTFIEPFYSVVIISELYRALSGRDVGTREMMRIAERSWNLWRLLNVKQGFSRKDDYPPGTWYTPLQSTSKELALHDYHNTRILDQEDVAGLLDDYYDERWWNPKSGAPSPKKLEELSLDNYA